MLTLLILYFLTNSPVGLSGVARKSGMLFQKPGTLEANQMCGLQELVITTSPVEMCKKPVNLLL